MPCLHTVIQEGLKKELELLNNQLEECKETHKREKELLEWKSSRGRFLNKIKVSRMIVICLANGRPEFKCWQRRRGSWGDAPENGGAGGGQIGIGKEKECVEVVKVENLAIFTKRIFTFPPPFALWMTLDKPWIYVCVCRRSGSSVSVPVTPIFHLPPLYPTHHLT